MRQWLRPVNKSSLSWTVMELDPPGALDLKQTKLKLKFNDQLIYKQVKVGCLLEDEAWKIGFLIETCFIEMSNSWESNFWRQLFPDREDYRTCHALLKKLTHLHLRRGRTRSHLIKTRSKQVVRRTGAHSNLANVDKMLDELQRWLKYCHKLPGIDWNHPHPKSLQQGTS